MKKFAVGICAATMAFVGMTAFAAENTTNSQDVYVGSNNSVHISGDNGVNMTEYQTVIIRKDGDTTDAGVVYIDQNNDGFSNVTNFMLKPDTGDGNYTATFGNKDGNSGTMKFTIGNITIGGKTFDKAYKMSALTSGTGDAVEQEKIQGAPEGINYKKGFSYLATLTDFDKFDTIYMVSADGKTCYGKFDIYSQESKPEFDGEGSIAFGVQIYNIPTDKKGMNLYLGGDAQ